MLFSKELLELDRNTVYFMIDELRQEIEVTDALIQKNKVQIREQDALIRELDTLIKKLDTLIAERNAQLSENIN